MILLSFDIEEFDLPEEHGYKVSIEKQIAVSKKGTQAILSCLKKHQIRATFFCTANFAIHEPDLIKQIIAEGHEVASHGFYHSSFETGHLKESRERLESITGEPVKGYRMARMMPINEEEIAKAGYIYNSSLNPTFIPGRYNNFHKPRTWFYQENVLQLPASVTPWIRFPLFWLACHNLPAFIYRRLCRRTLDHDKYLVIYFHPWEFVNLKEMKEYKLPFIVTNHTGQGMQKRLDDFIRYFKKNGYHFATTETFIREKIL